MMAVGLFGEFLMRATDLQGIVTATITVHSNIDTIMSDLGSALRAHGVAIRTVLDAAPLYANPGLLPALAVSVCREGMPSFLVTCNGKVRVVVGHEGEREVTLHEAFDAPMVAFMVDHPASHLSHLLRAPRNALVTVVDEGHLAFLEQAGLPPRSHIFCPHGGPEAIPDPRPARERGIDIMFAGNVGDPGPEAAWLDRVSGGRSDLRAALAEALEAVSAEGRDPYLAILEAFNRRGIATTPLEAAKYVSPLVTYANTAARFRTLRAITGHRVTIFGGISDTNALDHHEWRGINSFARVCGLMAETKLLINSPTFPRGGHERIFYGLSRGAVIAAGPSGFLREDMEAGLGMVLLPDDPAAIDDFLSDLLARPERLDELRRRGLASYAERHSWRERAGRILAALAALRFKS